MKRLIPAFLFVTFLAAGAPSLAAELQVGASDTVESVLKAQSGKRVTLRMRSGQELSGTVRTVNGKVVQIGAVSGREFFDAVVPLESVDAVLVRTKE